MQAGSRGPRSGGCPGATNHGAVRLSQGGLAWHIYNSAADLATAAVWGSGRLGNLRTAH